MNVLDVMVCQLHPIQSPIQVCMLTKSSHFHKRNGSVTRSGVTFRVFDTPLPLRSPTMPERLIRALDKQINPARPPTRRSGQRIRRPLGRLPRGPRTPILPKTPHVAIRSNTIDIQPVGPIRHDNRSRLQRPTQRLPPSPSTVPPPMPQRPIRPQRKAIQPVPTPRNSHGGQTPARPRVTPAHPS